MKQNVATKSDILLEYECCNYNTAVCCVVNEYQSRQLFFSEDMHYLNFLGIIFSNKIMVHLDIKISPPFHYINPWERKLRRFYKLSEYSGGNYSVDIRNKLVLYRTFIKCSSCNLLLNDTWMIEENINWMFGISNMPFQELSVTVWHTQSKLWWDFQIKMKPWLAIILYLWYGERLPEI